VTGFNPITNQNLIGKLKNTVKKEHDPSVQLILQTEAKAHAFSMTYKKFTQDYSNIFQARIENESELKETETQREVKNFYQAFQEHQLEGQTLQETLADQRKLTSKSVGLIVGKYVES
jgi:hypothetical protein